MDEPAICLAIADSLLCKYYRLPFLSLAHGLNTILVIGRFTLLETVDRWLIVQVISLDNSALGLCVSILFVLKCLPKENSQILK